MKKKGFTLIELIVVIAIIGVLAAILVPAMLGYVRKSKITTANTTAKQVYNAANTSLVDMDTEDMDITKVNVNGTSFSKVDWSSISGTTETDIFKTKVSTYFSDQKKATYQMELKEGQCIAVGVMNGVYPGSYPKQMSVDVYKNSSSGWTTSGALTYGKG